MFQVLFFFCVFSACELLEGKRAAPFGLNEPKYEYAVEEYNRGYGRRCALLYSYALCHKRCQKLVSILNNLLLK